MDFDYGIVELQPRFNLSRALDDYPVTRLENCISISLSWVYKTVACDKLVAEVYIIHRDSPTSTKLVKFDLHETTFRVLYKGDMRVRL